MSMPSRDDFAAMLEESFEGRSPAEGSVIKGTIVAIENDFAVVDVGPEDRRPRVLKRIFHAGRAGEGAIGDTVEVSISERVENAMGEAVLSRDKARREESWIKLERAFNDQTVSKA
ncbi:MAG: hypothetical protein WDM89_09860 [Rhizomicrobium sp.]